jgi:hypothetical protein
MEKSELVAGLLALKQNEYFQYVMSNYANWKQQAVDEIMSKKNLSEDEQSLKGEWTAYGRCINFVDQTIANLQAQSDTDMSDFDAFSQTTNQLNTK